MTNGSGEKRKGPLIVLSGPSGSGKSTLVAGVLAAKDLPVRKSVSATTRSIRPGEVDGQHYHFWTEAQFDEGIRDGRFIEWASVYGHRYGTLHSEVDRYRDAGLCVLLEIDVQGAMQVRQQCPDAVLVFLKASSQDEYARRIQQRPTETGADLKRRIRAAHEELTHAKDYDHVIVNDNLQEAVEVFHKILERCGGDRRVG